MTDNNHTPQESNIAYLEELLENTKVMFQYKVANFLTEPTFVNKLMLISWTNQLAEVYKWLEDAKENES